MLIDFLACYALGLGFMLPVAYMLDHEAKVCNEPRTLHPILLALVWPLTLLYLLLWSEHEP